MVWTIRVEHTFVPPPVCAGCESMAQLRADFLSLKEFTMTTQAEVAANITNITAAVAKIETETRGLLTKIADLTAAVEAAGNATPEVLDALAALQAQVAVVDELVPDA